MKVRVQKHNCPEVDAVPLLLMLLATKPGSKYVGTLVRENFNTN